MPTTQLIFNPMANHGRSGQVASDLRPMIDELGGADWHATKYPGHASEVAGRAADAGYETIIALGGDGTVHEVVNGLMRIPAERRPRLGIVPMGSGNDFALGAGVPEDSMQAIQRAYAPESWPIDVGVIRDGGGRTEYFDNTCGIGMDAAINIRSRKLTFVHGFLMYLTATLQTIALNFDAPQMKVAYDGATLDQPVLLFTVGNGRRQGGGFIVTPDAVFDDGVLNFVYVGKVSQVRMMQLLPKFLNGTHIKEPDVHLGTAKRLVIDTDRAVPIHTDGELFAPYEADVRHVEIEIQPAAIRLAGAKAG